MAKGYGLRKRIALYISFWVRAKPSSTVHSPMIFKLIRKLRKSDKNRAKYSAIEKLRNALHQDHSIVHFDDLGDNGAKKQRRISAISKGSAKNKRLSIVLADIIEFVNPNVAIELGTSLGISLAYQQMASPNTTFVSLEGSPEIAELAKKNLDQLGLSAPIRIGHFDDTLPDVLNELKTVDFAFIDGNHQEEPTLDYVNQLMAHLTSEGCLVIDDIYWSQGMQNAWKKICADKRVTLSVDLFHLGIVFNRSGVEKQHFKLRL